MEIALDSHDTVRNTYYVVLECRAFIHFGSSILVSTCLAISLKFLHFVCFTSNFLAI